MCDCSKKGFEDLEEGVFPGFIFEFRTASEIAKDMTEVILSRHDACNAFIAAAAKALENNPEDPVGLVESVNDIVILLTEGDQTLLELIDFIDETESACPDCLCCGCPYAGECGGDCYFEDEDFFKKDEEGNKEE